MQDNEHLLELPHCIFDMMFVPYILKMSDEKNEDVLYAIGLF